MVFIIITFTFVIILTNNNAFAQPLHEKTLYRMVNEPLNSEINSQIDVGDRPTVIAFNSNTETIYVVNAGSDTVSVISGENNTKIGEDITVGKKERTVGERPTSIGINHHTNLIYLGNSDTISVISGENNTKIGEDITVGNKSTVIGSVLLSMKIQRQFT